MTSATFICKSDSSLVASGDRCVLPLVASCDKYYLSFVALA